MHKFLNPLHILSEIAKDQIVKINMYKGIYIFMPIDHLNN